jgi:hypothetical protein
MATFTAQGAFNDAAIPVINEETVQLVEATPARWSFSDGHVLYTYTGTGFTFADGEPITGEVTGWSVTVDGAPVFTVTGGSYAVSGPASPTAILGFDIWDGGYLSGSGHPVFAEQADLAWLLRSDDVVNGSALGDHLSGFQGNDHIFGNAGNDVLRGWGGNDALDGGAGIDIAGYFNARSITVLTATETGWTVNVPANGGQTDTVINVERLVFNGSQGIALDLDGNAGQVAKLIGAVFGASVVANETIIGIGLLLMDGGMTYEALGALAMSASGAATNAAVVQRLWLNLTGSQISEGTQAVLVGMLDAGLSVGALTAVAADTGINQANIGLVGLAETGLAFQFQGTLG